MLEWKNNLETSSVVTQGKDVKFDKVNGGGKQAEAEIPLISRFVWTLWILSEKNLANDWDKRLESHKMVEQAKKSDEEVYFNFNHHLFRTLGACHVQT